MGGFLEKFLLVDLFQALWVTFRNQNPKYIYTEQYPTERPRIAERFRGAPRLNINPDTNETLCELSGAVRKSETVTLRHPVVPVADAFLSGFVRVYGLELRKRNGHLPRLPADLHQHVVLAGILCGHT